MSLNLDWPSASGTSVDHDSCRYDMPNTSQVDSKPLLLKDN